MFLAPDFFDKDDKLFQSIRERLLSISNDIIEDLRGKGVDFEPAFIVLTGSLTGVNYDERSDVDLHFGVNFEEFGDVANIYRNLLDLYARNFNNKGYKIKNRKLEIYFEDVNEVHETPGLYDILHDVWLKIPDRTPRVLNSKVNQAANEYLNKVNILIFEWGNTPKTSESIRLFLDKINAFFKQLREMRKLSLLHDGLYGFGNLVFKRLRRDGTLEKLSNLRSEVTRELYDVRYNMESKSRANNLINKLKEGLLWGL